MGWVSMGSEKLSHFFCFSSFFFAFFFFVFLRPFFRFSSPFFSFFFALFFVFLRLFLFVFLRLFFFAFLGEGQKTAIYWKNGEFHPDAVRPRSKLPEGWQFDILDRTMQASGVPDTQTHPRLRHPVPVFWMSLSRSQLQDETGGAVGLGGDPKFKGQHD